jgi:sec-independent protein translocase protein TatC
MATTLKEDLFEGTKMTFGEHLEEFRVALFRAVAGLLIGTLIGFAISKRVVAWIEVPLKAALDEYYLNKAKSTLEAQYGTLSADMQRFIERERMVFDDVFLERSEIRRWLEQADSHGTGPSTAEPQPPTTDLVKTRIWSRSDGNIQTLNAQEGFLIWVKVAVLSGAVIAGPWVFWQIWMFVAAGLYPREKHYVYLFLPFSLGLFVIGAATAYLFVFQPVLQFLFSFNAALEIDPTPRISEWLGFVMMLPLGFGISFQLPLVMLFLNRIGIFSLEAYLSRWRIAVLVIFVLAMFLTPADPISMLLLALPLTVLYFGGVALCKWLPKPKSPYGEGYDPK